VGIGSPQGVDRVRLCKSVYADFPCRAVEDARPYGGRVEWYTVGGGLPDAPHGKNQNLLT